jgi:hypothetical protein
MAIDMPWEDSLDMPVPMAAVDGYPGARECIRALKLSTLVKMVPLNKWWTFGIEQHEGLAQYLPGGLNFLDSVLLSRQILRLITKVNSANTRLSSVRKQTNQTVRGVRLRTVPTGVTTCTVGTMVPLVQVLVQVVRLEGMSMRLTKFPIRVSFVVEIEFYGVEFRTRIRSLLLWSIELAVVSKLVAVKA